MPHELARVAVVEQNLADAAADRRVGDHKRAETLRELLEVRGERAERDRVQHLLTDRREPRAPEARTDAWRLGAAALLGVPRVNGGAGLRPARVDGGEAVGEGARERHGVRVPRLRGGRRHRDQAAEQRGECEMAKSSLTAQGRGV
jgi:hypothetical protein